MDKSMVIPEGSKVQVMLKGCSSDYVIATAETSRDIKIEANSIMMIDGGLACTDSWMPVEKINDDTYQINVYIQDAYGIRNGYLIESITESD